MSLITGSCHWENDMMDTPNTSVAIDRVTKVQIAVANEMK